MVDFKDLEGTLADEFESGAKADVGLNPQIARVANLKGRAGDPAVKPVLKKAEDESKKLLSLFYKSTQPGLDENALNQQVGNAYNLLVNPTEQTAPTRAALSALLTDFGKQLYATMPNGRKVAFAKELQGKEFENVYGVKLDAWKDGTLIDKFRFDTLEDNYKTAILNALKESNGGSIRGLLNKAGQLQSITKQEAESGNVDPQVIENREKAMKAIAKELDGLVEAYITGVYGFSKEASVVVANAVKSNPESLKIFGPLFANAAKKALQTMGSDKQEDIAKYRGQEIIKQMYSAPEVPIAQAS